jgi:hypothetical protein
MNYELDTGSARKADQRGGMISETGKYIGRFVRAEEITTDKGTKGIDFSFVSKDNLKTRFALYTEKKDGSRISIGYAFVMALMTCLKLRGMKPAETRVKKWDNDANAEVDVVAPCYTELMNKDIGVLLEAEEYEKTNGSIGKRMVLAGVFQAQSELTASEVLDQKVKAEQLPKMVASLRDRPLKGNRPAQRSAPAAAGGVDFDDDIPF